MSKSITIKADRTGRSGGITIGLKDTNALVNDHLPENTLGLVQTARWEATVGGVATCQIETIMTEADLEVALENAEIRVRLRPNEKCWLCRWKQKRMLKRLMKKIRNKE